MSGKTVAVRRALVKSMSRWALAVSGGAVLLQTSACGVDPDLILQAVIQFATETAIFFTDNAIAGL